MDVIKVEKRNEQAKANQLRRSGLVPCCVYGGLQIFQHVLLFLLLLKLLQLGFPFLLTDIQQVLDLLLGVGVFQDQEVGKGVRVDEFLFTGGKTDGDHVSVPICDHAFSEGNVFD